MLAELPIELCFQPALTNGREMLTYRNRLSEIRIIKRGGRESSMLESSPEKVGWPFPPRTVQKRARLSWSR